MGPEIVLPEVYAGGLRDGTCSAIQFHSCGLPVIRLVFEDHLSVHRIDARQKKIHIVVRLTRFLALGLSVGLGQHEADVPKADLVKFNIVRSPADLPHHSNI